jgi:hypothetical protein
MNPRSVQFQIPFCIHHAGPDPGAQIRLHYDFEKRPINNFKNALFEKFYFMITKLT